MKNENGGLQTEYQIQELMVKTCKKKIDIIQNRYMIMVEHLNNRSNVMEEVMTVQKYKIKGIDCANCAKELEEEIGKLDGVSDCVLDFGITSHLRYNVIEGKEAETEKAMIKIIEDDQDNPIIEKEEEKKSSSVLQKFRVQGIDCAACAKELEEEIGKLDGVSNCTLEFGISSHLRYEVEADKEEAVEHAMRKIIEDDQDNPIIEKEETCIHCVFTVDGIDCAACAKELEEEIGKLDGVSNCTLEFGIHSHLEYDVEKKLDSVTEEKMRKIIEDDQDNPVIVRHNAGKTKTYDYRIHLIDCADCAQKLCDKTKEIEGVQDARVDFVSEKLSFTCSPKDRARIEKEMIAMIGAEEPEVQVSVYETKKKEEEDDDDNPKVMIARLIGGALLFTAGMLTKETVSTVLALAAYIILGYDVLIKAVRNIMRGNWFDEHFLMGIATIAAIYLGDFDEAAGVMLFYQIGEFFQDMAVRRSRKSISELMDIRPEFANVKRDGELVMVDPDEVEIGEIISVKPGEKIPLDGVVVKGASTLDTSSLTGESKPRDIDVDDEVISGSVNETGLIEIRVTKEYGESTVAKILDLVENNDANKAEHEKFITKFSHYYTPTVVISAIVVAIIVSVVLGNLNEGIYRACTFLVISCPCALVISIPLSFFAGIGGLSSRGILVKGANVIDSLVKVNQVVFDKTGTLTSGTFAVSKTLDTNDESSLIYHAALAESYSNHPIAVGIRNAYGKEIDQSVIQNIEEIPGRGIKAETKEGVILAGNAKLMSDNGIETENSSEQGTFVHVAKDGIYEGCLVLKDQLKKDSKEAIDSLHKAGRKCAVVSGDAKEITETIGKELGVDEIYGSCLPEDKVAVLKNLKESGLVTAFVGDGVNDAPVLANADVSFAMGGVGSDAAVEVADVVLMDDKPSAVTTAIEASHRILSVANQNIIFAIAIKILTLILGAFGIANMWMAIFADTGVAMLCVLNSMRLLRIARK